MNTCGHDAPRVTDAPRCTECGAYAHGVDEPQMKVAPPLQPPLLEWLVRRHVRRHLQPPVLEGHVRRVP